MPTDFVAQVWAVTALTPQHNYQVLTSGPSATRRSWTARAAAAAATCPASNPRLVQAHPSASPRAVGDLMGTWPLGNVWLGTSIENDD